MQLRLLCALVVAAGTALTQTTAPDLGYEVDPGWPELPAGWNLKETPAVEVDARNHTYIFHRGPNSIIELNPDGKLVRSWGEGQFKRPHGLQLAPDDTLLCTDDGEHTVRRCTLDGRELMRIGVAGQPSPYMSGKPFCACTHTALSPTGDIYVSDGYGNARVHKYSPDGKHLLSWGSSGTEPGQFNLPHNIACDADGWVYVADRENHRIQVFGGSGRFETQWHDLHRPSGMFMPAGKCPICGMELVKKVEPAVKSATSVDAVPPEPAPETIATFTHPLASNWIGPTSPSVIDCGDDWYKPPTSMCLLVLSVQSASSMYTTSSMSCSISRAVKSMWFSMARMTPWSAATFVASRSMPASCRNCGSWG
jgi:DNA-binding beta-propeller fold protein YncE